MIQVTPQMRILVAIEPADFRKGIDGLARVCREVLSSDPFSGCVFVFRNKSRKGHKKHVFQCIIKGFSLTGRWIIWYM